MKIPGHDIYGVYYLRSQMITDEKTNLDAQEGLEAETIMRNENTVWTEGENMTGDSLDASHTKVH